jgi:hypothetical protein
LIPLLRHQFATPICEDILPYCFLFAFHFLLLRLSSFSLPSFITLSPPFHFQLPLPVAAATPLMLMLILLALPFSDIIDADEFSWLMLSWLMPLAMMPFRQRQPLIRCR